MGNIDSLREAQDARRWAAIETATQAAAALDSYIPLTSPETLDALLGLGLTDRKRAEGKLLDSARALRKKTEVAGVLKAATKEFISRQKEANANRTQYSQLPDGITEQLFCGGFRADDTGIYLTLYSADGPTEEIRVCSHPVLPLEYYEGIEDGVQRVRLGFFRRDRWRAITVERQTTASRLAIVSLSAQGVDVTTETARYLVQYLSDIEAQNEGRIPRVDSIGRLGWVNMDFSPYIAHIKFDGDDQYRDLFRAVAPTGDKSAWIDKMLEIRKRPGYARVCLAAGFAAPLVGLLDGQPFFLHLWGGTEAGKTVAMMVAASIWGNPALGKMLRTFSSTSVGMELLAGFLHHVPVCLDELQTAKYDGDFDKTIYMLGEGQGKTRGQKTGGLQQTHTWRTVIISNGEHPITSGRSGGGAKNRVLEAECQGALFADPARAADCVKDNYGHAGPLFVEKLREIGADELREQYLQAVSDMAVACDTTAKQRNSAAFLLLADRIATDLFFHDRQGLQPFDLAPLLPEACDIKTFNRAMDFLSGWVASNADKFEATAASGQTWGRRTADGYMAIIGSVFDDAMEKAGFSSQAFLSDADAAGILQKDSDGKRKKKVRFPDDNLPRCVVIKLGGGEKDALPY